MYPLIHEHSLFWYHCFLPPAACAVLLRMKPSVCQKSRCIRQKSCYFLHHEKNGPPYASSLPTGRPSLHRRLHQSGQIAAHLATLSPWAAGPRGRKQLVFSKHRYAFAAIRNMVAALGRLRSSATAPCCSYTARYPYDSIQSLPASSTVAEAPGSLRSQRANPMFQSAEIDGDKGREALLSSHYPLWLDNCLGTLQCLRHNGPKTD